MILSLYFVDGHSKDECHWELKSVESKEQVRWNYEDFGDEYILHFAYPT